MTEVLAVITPLLLIDVMNPVLFAMLILAAGSNRPVANSSAMLLGHTLAYITVGVLVSFAVEKISHRLDNPQPLDYGIQIVLALACLYGALASRDGGASEPGKPLAELTALKCLAFGAVINFIGAPFALPYLAVIDQLASADIPVVAAWSLLLAYNLAYAAPFALVPLLVAVMGDRATPVLQKINDVMTRGADMLMPWILLLLGLGLLADAIVFFLTGSALI
jgi:cytochrome c biogenesis protein CcdA